MIIGVISDAHGNIYGLKRCLDLLEGLGVEKIFFLGDAVNFFSKSGEVLELLRSNKKIKCIKGNHEIMILEQKDIPPRERQVYNLDFTESVLKKDHYDTIKSWEDSIELKFGDFKILMVHASPFNYFQGYVYPDSNLSRFRDLEYEMVFMAHTHVPFVKKIGTKILVNVGSAGFSRCDGRYINCAIFDSEERRVRILQEKFPQDLLDNLQPFHQDLYKVLGRRQLSEGILNEAR